MVGISDDSARAEVMHDWYNNAAQCHLIAALQMLERCCFCKDLTPIPELLNQVRSQSKSTFVSMRDLLRCRLQAISLLEPEQAHKFYESTVVCGGSCLFPRSEKGSVSLLVDSRE
jgi:hypothetical protein